LTLSVDVDFRDRELFGDFGKQRLIALTGLAPGRMNSDERGARNRQHLVATPCQYEKDNQSSGA